MYNEHIPVLLDPVLETLSDTWLTSQRLTNKGGVVCVDATLGLGGHAHHIISRLSSGDTYIGYDRDADNLKKALEILEPLAQKRGVELITTHASYRDIIDSKIYFDFLLGDFGVSSVHYDRGELGFSTRHEGPLDMRFDRTSTSTTQTATQYLASVSSEELLKVLYQFGEEKKARFIVDAIMKRRAIKPIQTTEDLVDIIKGSSFDPKSSIRVFQAIRIAVNHEFDELEYLISHINSGLKPGGKIALISFHSLEDRLIKENMKIFLENEIDSWSGKIKKSAPLQKISKKPIIATEAETEANPRSRSAKLRTYEKPFSK
ncbi:MAG: 16S rRNA (cytosine(1402)-N(4))-methyltransferase RsmH [Candidatus Gracilibacteria bacterium]